MLSRTSWFAIAVAMFFVVVMAGAYVLMRLNDPNACTGWQFINLLCYRFVD